LVIRKVRAISIQGSVGLAIGPVSETANDVYEALSKARQMCDTGLVNVHRPRGHKIDGDELMACITEKKTITEDLRVAPNSIQSGDAE
jgi:hypothetical protein